LIPGMPSVVLLVTETSDLAADLLVLAARRRGIPLVRFNQDLFPREVRIAWSNDGEARFVCEGRSFREGDVSGAWFRRPFGRGGASAVEAFTARQSAACLDGVWETVRWFWMNAPAATARAELKLLQLRHAQRLGFVIPDTLVTNIPSAARGFVRSREAIAKTLAGGRMTLDGKDHAIFTSAVVESQLGADAAIEACPVIFQPRIDSCFDVRVTVVGNRVFPARIVVRNRRQSEVDWRCVDRERIGYEHHRLPAGVERKCLALVAAFGLAYGALDLLFTPSEEYIFLELNPAGQWGWIERALGLPVADAILDRLREGSRCA
jgi:hypothetical protein